MATTRCPKLMCMMRSASQWSLPLAQLLSNCAHTFSPKMPWSNICPIHEARPWALLQYAVGLTYAAVTDQVNNLLGHPHMAWRSLSHKLGNCCCMQAVKSECMSIPTGACSATPDKASLLGRLSCCSEAM